MHNLSEKEELVKAVGLGCIAGFMIAVTIIYFLGNWILNNLARLFL